MSELKLGTWSMPAARLGPENPLPPLRANDNASTAGQAIRYAAEDQTRARGDENEILPYLMQDQYDRTRKPRNFKTAVLENEYLRATFLLEIGGRLWSLVDKTTGRELLYVNPVFQPANLALRDAWISGGVEWNCGIIGHTPFTVSPIFAAKLKLSDGTPVLRLYEWERVRGVPWQVDAYLPAGSRFLFTRVRIVNPHEEWIPMYWWSNIAVPETRSTRVIAPATGGYRHAYDGGLAEVSLPHAEGIDITYPTNHQYARDLYFDIPKQQRKWVAALDQDGIGLVHASTSRLFGRKAFNWGVNPGGAQWQEFLSVPNRPYVEIQGGLATAQSDYRRMPGKAQWEWLEAYGLMNADVERTHRAGWADAIDDINTRLASLLPESWLEEELLRTSAMARQAPDEILCSGSGWPALEQRRRLSAGEPVLADAGIPFDSETLSEVQAPWLTLLETGRLPYLPPAATPPSPMVQVEWRTLLERSLRQPDCDHWLAWYQLGIMRFRAGDREGAGQAWNASLERAPSAWAYRNLAVLARQDGEIDRAAELWELAHELAPTLLPLAIECGLSLLAAGRPASAKAMVATLPMEMRRNWRLQLLAVRASLEQDQLDEAEEILGQPMEITNVREGEVNLTDAWFRLQEKRFALKAGTAVTEEIRRKVLRECIPPRRFDFRLYPQKI